MISSRRVCNTATTIRHHVLWVFIVTLILTLISISIFVDLKASKSGKSNAECPCNGKNFKVLESLMQGPLEQDDPRVIWFIRNSGYLKPPTDQNIPYNLTNPGVDPSHGQSDVIKKIFNFKRNGYFVESGAFDGEIRSNTLSLEKDFGWTGLLIEPDLKNFKLMEGKNRKCWSSPSCLSVHPYPHQVSFYENGSTGRIAFDPENKKNPRLFALFSRDGVKVNDKTFTNRQCFPIFSLLTALNVSTVDYFSLDVEGAELDILETIPFKSIYIKVLSVEITHGSSGKGTLNVLKEFMEKQGYKFVTRVISPYSFANDLIFAHNQFNYTAKFSQEIFHWNSTYTVDNYYKTG